MVHFSQRRIEAYSGAVSRLEEGYRSDFARKKESYSELKRKLEALKAKTDENISKAQHELELAKSVLAHNKAKLAEYEKKHSECLSKIQKSENECKNIPLPAETDEESKKERERATSEIEKIKTEISALKNEEKKLAALKEKAGKSIAPCEQLIKTIEESISRLKNYRSKLCSGLDSLIRSFDALQGQYGSLEQTLRSTCDRINNAIKPTVWRIYSCFQSAGFSNFDRDIIFSNNGNELLYLCNDFRSAIYELEAQAKALKRECYGYYSDLRNGITEDVLANTEQIISKLNEMQSVLSDRTNQLENAGKLIGSLSDM